MIQRIQTLYLFIAAILLGVVNFFPLAHCRVDEGFYTMTSLGIEASGTEVFSGPEFWCWFLPAISILSIAFTLAALFGYKNRIAQMRRCIYAILTIIAYYIIFGIEIWHIYSTTTIFPDLALLAELPFIAIILIFLAGRAIKRDEDMVRSMDRIR